MEGYLNNFLEIDLADEAYDTMSLDEDILREYLGGAGLAAKLFLDRGLYEVDPLEPENTLFVMTGPLAGTGFPGAGRFSVCAKSPLTNLWGEANCGGHFGAVLKFAGYDGIIINGKADDPMYIYINDDEIEFRDASHLWGKDVYEIEELIREDLDDKWLASEVRILSIGQAGENQVKYAAIAGDKGDFAARCGLGAVMGAKNLKAIVVHGTKSVMIADPEGYKKANDSAMAHIGESDLSKAWRTHGTAIGMVAGTKHAGVSGKNWAKSDLYAFAKPIRGFAITNYLTKNQSCHGCPIGCKRVIKVDEGPYETKEGPGPEFQTVLNFGLTLMNDNLEAVFKCNELCNKYGMDTVSCGSVLGFAMECFEKGLITLDDTDGVDLTWGNIDGAIEMIHKIGNRDGFGDVLAEGVRTAAEKIGGDAMDYAIHVKGMEMPMHDPRGFHGMGLSQAIPSRGSTHTDCIHFLIEENFAKFPELELHGDYEAQVSEGKALMTLKSESLANICNASSMCLYVMGTISYTDLVDAHRTITGWDFTGEELMESAERMVLLKRGLSCLMGQTSADEVMPKRIMTPLEEGATKGSVPNMELMLKEYYELRGIDENGVPTKEKLEALNMSDLAEELGL